MIAAPRETDSRRPWPAEGFRQLEEPEDLGAREAGDGGDAVALDGEDHDPVRAVLAVVPVAHVRGEGGLAVGAGRAQGDVVEAAAGRDGGEEAGDRLGVAFVQRGPKPPG